MSGSEIKFDNPNRKPLTEEEKKKAVNALFLGFPREVKNKDRDPPISGQNWALVSFSQFPKPKFIKQKHRIDAFFKVRGTYDTLERATEEMVKIVELYDSVYRIAIVPVGEWRPVSNDPYFYQETVEVKPGESPDGSSDPTSIKEREQNQKRLHEIKEYNRELEEHYEIAQQERKKKQYEERNALHEREKKLLSEDLYSQPFALHFYISRRIIEMRLKEHVDRLKLQLEQATIQLSRSRRTIKKLEKKNPSYKDEWLDEYNSLLEAPITPREDQFKDLEEYDPGELSDPDEDEIRDYEHKELRRKFDIPDARKGGSRQFGSSKPTL